MRRLERRRRRRRRRHDRGRGDRQRGRLEVRSRHREEGDRRADQAWRDRHQAPRAWTSRHHRVAKAYFDCVNDNGGINGHPVEYIVEEQAPTRSRSARWRRSSSSTTRSVVRRQHEHPRLPGEPRALREERLSTDRRGRPERVLQHAEHRRLNMGPLTRASARCATWSPRRREGHARHRLAQAAGHEAGNQGALPSQAEGPEDDQPAGDVPITDARRSPKRSSTQAGDGGGVVLDFTPPEGVKIMQAVAQQGLIDKVKWGSRRR